MKLSHPYEEATHSIQRMAKDSDYGNYIKYKDG